MLEKTELVSIDFATNQAIRTAEGVEERQPLRPGPNDFAVATWADGTTHQTQVSNLLLLVDRAPLRSAAKNKAKKRPAAAAKKRPAAAAAEEAGESEESEEEEQDDPDEQEDEEPPAADGVHGPPEEKQDRRAFEHHNVHLKKRHDPYGPVKGPLAYHEASSLFSEAC